MNADSFTPESTVARRMGPSALGAVDEMSVDERARVDWPARTARVAIFARVGFWKGVYGVGTSVGASREETGTGSQRPGEEEEEEGERAALGAPKPAGSYS